MKPLIIILTCLHASISCVAQTDSTKVADSLPKQKSSLTLAAVYANDASYYGQRAQNLNPYAALAATYQHKSGIYLSGLAYRLLNEKTAEISAATLGAGINMKLGKKLFADLNFTHSFYETSSPLIQSVNTENAGIAVTHKGWLESSISGDYSFGTTEDYFTSAALAKDISLFQVGKNAIVSIKPVLSVVAGTQRYYKSYVTQQQARDSALGIITTPIFGSPNPETVTTEKEAVSFNLLSYNFELPVSYSRGRYLLEAAYQVSLLSDKVRSGAGDINQFGKLSFYYQF